MGNYKYYIKNGYVHGAFNIGQSKTGAIYLAMGKNYTVLSLAQINELLISVYDLMDFDYSLFKLFYNL